MRIWIGPGDLTIHCVGCPNYDPSLPPRPTPFVSDDGYGHPWCLLVKPGENLPPQYKGPLTSNTQGEL